MFLLISERERERGKHQFSPACSPTRDLTCNLGMCPDQESNLQPFGIWDNAPTNWATWPGQKLFFIKKYMERETYVVGMAHFSHPLCFSLPEIRCDAWKFSCDFLIESAMIIHWRIIDGALNPLILSSGCFTSCAFPTRRLLYWNSECHRVIPHRKTNK